MGVTTPTRNALVTGRVSSKLLSELRSRIRKGRFGAGEYLPTVRQISAAHGLARKTVNGVLKKLEAEGLVSAEPRKGYRVLARAADPDQGCPLAYVADLKNSPDSWLPLHQELLSAFQGAAAQKGWTLMGIGSQGRDREAVMRQLVGARACGLALDSVDAGLLQLIRKVGVPAVVVDSWYEDFPIDCVMQDGYQGGILAAGFLAERGHERIAWLGPTSWSTHSQARVAGTIAGLMRRGRRLRPEMIVECPRDDSARQARELLSREDRPTGIVSLYRETATTLVRTARELGLTLGEDPEIVGWATEEEYQRDWLPLFRDERPAPCVIWSPRTMAELAVDRLDAQRRNPGLRPVKISVPVALRVPDRDRRINP